MTSLRDLESQSSTTKISSVDVLPIDILPQTGSESKACDSSIDEKNTDDHDDDSYTVNFSSGDEAHPLNFSRRKKWTLTAVASFFTVLVSTSATSFGMGNPSMMHDLHATQFQATLGLSLYMLGFGVFPLLTSAFSEEFGRQPMYYISIGGFLVVHVLVAVFPNIQLVAFARFVQGAFGSTGATMVAGTLADIWIRQERGLPMCFWSVLAFTGNGIGALMGGWTELNPKLGWKWIQWIQLIFGSIYFLVVLLVIEETRPAVILAGRAKVLRKKTGDDRYRPFVAGSKQITLREQLYMSCTRPLYFLLTEPIVLAVSLWIGLAWGVYFCMIDTIPAVFRTLHGFNQGEIGTVYASIIVGCSIGLFTNFYQERFYQREVHKRGHEARLFMALPAAVLFPASMFMFAWSATPKVPWIVLVIALVIYIWSIFTIYLAVFTYLADGYGTYASSALSGQSLFRNLMSAVFPLFSDKMFASLGYHWANTLFACAAVMMIPIPVALFFYGSRLWAKSRYKEAM